VIDHRVLVGGAVLLLAVVAAVATRRLRFPLLIAFLIQGLTLEPFARRLGVTTEPR
jgi:predicted Kef-type K+ transport protein